MLKTRDLIILIMLTVSLILVLTLHTLSAPSKYDALSDEFIDEINKYTTTWTAGRNYPANLSKIILDSIMGQRVISSPVIPEIQIEPYGDKKTREYIPEFFDARIKWRHCPTLWDIRDQGACGACWAISAAATISDRICIHSNGTVNARISTEHLLSCVQGGGCDGGDPWSAWNYWFTTGVVSGGVYGSNQGCQPFGIPPVEFGPTKPDTPKCKAFCTNANYDTEFETDRHFGRIVYRVPGGQNAIQLEILYNGPVAAIIDVYEDLIHYKKGVYQHVYGYARGGHVVKIIGWGVENDVPYWLIANSFNASWGDNGYAKFLRGFNHCDIESYVIAGIPENEDFRKNLV